MWETPGSSNATADAPRPRDLDPSSDPSTGPPPDPSTGPPPDPSTGPPPDPSTGPPPGQAPPGHPPVRMQAVGQLAAGLAHDLNTLLGGIVATAELLAAEAPPGSRQADDLAAIIGQAGRAAALIRQLLAFSRQEMLRPQAVRLGELVARMAPLIRAQVGRQLGLCLPPGRGPLVRADAQALERVILNLVTNARDAIGPRPGRIEIACGTIAPDAIPPEARGFMPGRSYATLSVSDDGPGVPPEHAARIFEPYFTTKPAGEGSGLGLATAYGLVKQSGGFLLLDRAARRGARFTIYLPLAEAPAAAGADAPQRPAAAGPRVLVVEDEAVLRAAIARAIGRQGLEVLCAEDGLRALDLLAGPEGEDIGLIISDIRMPGLDGVMLAERALALRPGLPVLLVSGYADAPGRGRLAELEVGFLAKPFALSDLLARVEAMLAR
jgi:two-component system cell cycle sensor histidine kinase/response regulator CckA